MKHPVFKLLAVVALLLVSAFVARADIMVHGKSPPQTTTSVVQLDTYASSICGTGLAALEPLTTGTTFAAISFTVGTSSTQGVDSYACAVSVGCGYRDMGATISAATTSTWRTHHIGKVFSGSNAREIMSKCTRTPWLGDNVGDRT